MKQTMRTVAVISTVFALTTAACGSSSKSSVTTSAPSTVPTSDSASSSTAAPQTTASDGSPYTIYAVIDQTGALGPVYTPGAAGIQAFFKQLNERGGVNGHKIDLKVVDSQSTTEGAGALYRQAIDAKPVAIFNMSASSGFSGVAPLLVQTGIPVLGVGAADSLLYPPAPNIYMLQPTSEQQVKYGLGLVKSLRKSDLKGVKIAMVGLSPSSIIDAAYKKITDAVEAEGGSIAKVERPTSPIASFTTQAVGIAQAKPDAVFVNLGPADATTVAKALNDAGLNVPIIVLPSSGTDAPKVFQAINSPNYYAVRFAQVPGETSHAALAGTDYADSATWATGWMFGAIVASALTKCGANCTSSQLNDTLQTKGPFDLGDTLFAPVTFSKTSHSAVSAVQFFVWNAASSKPVAAGGVIDVDEK